jgi:hypothetical protein
MHFLFIIQQYQDISEERVKRWLWEDEFRKNPNQLTLLEDMISNRRDSSVYTPFLEHHYLCNSWDMIREQLSIQVLRCTTYPDLVGSNLVCIYGEPCIHPLQQQITQLITRDDILLLSDLLTCLDPIADQINIFDLSCRSLYGEPPSFNVEEIYEIEHAQPLPPLIYEIEHAQPLPPLKPWSYYRTGEEEEGRRKYFIHG